LEILIFIPGFNGLPDAKNLEQLNSQEQQQYFDGADTIVGQSIFINLDTSVTNIWQIGPPQKRIFDAATTLPNVLVTDTINNYPINNNSSFSFPVNSDLINWGILAVQWTQKLDMDHGKDGGLIEYSTDGTNWENVFNSSYVYSFYGFENENKDTLENGTPVFTGVDSLWRDIWLCFDGSWVSSQDTLQFRFTLTSDSIDNNREGWMIDNLLNHITFIHTLSEVEQKEYIRLYPNPTSGIVNIETQKINEFHIIENMQLFNVEGKLVESFGTSPTKFSIDISDHPRGVYFLKINTNLKTETVRIVLQYE